MVESKRNSAKLLWVIGTAWLFDALDVALLSFVMPRGPAIICDAGY